jgi:hypothetical protein
LFKLEPPPAERKKRLKLTIHGPKSYPNCLKTTCTYSDCPKKEIAVLDNALFACPMNFEVSLDQALSASEAAFSLGHGSGVCEGRIYMDV